MNANRGVDRSPRLGFERHPIDAPSIDARIYIAYREYRRRLEIGTRSRNRIARTGIRLHINERDLTVARIGSKIITELVQPFEIGTLNEEKENRFARDNNVITTCNFCSDMMPWIYRSVWRIILGGE